MPQPVIRLLDLPAVVEALGEHPILVTEPIAAGGDAAGGHAVHQTCGKPAKTTIAEAGILLKLCELIEIMAGRR
jgi:hypothetical protein